MSPPRDRVEKHRQAGAVERDDRDQADDRAAAFRRRRDATVDEVRAALRRAVHDSRRTQRSIERDNGFRAGYLSQVLQGHITLTARHLIGVLQALDMAPNVFFGGLVDASLEEPWPAAEPVLSEIRERLAVYDAALDQLARKGLVEMPGETSAATPTGSTAKKSAEIPAGSEDSET